jgi:hypothetical protein
VLRVLVLFFFFLLSFVFIRGFFFYGYYQIRAEHGTEHTAAAFFRLFYDNFSEAALGNFYFPVEDIFRTDFNAELAAFTPFFLKFNFGHYFKLYLK